MFRSVLNESKNQFIRPSFKNDTALMRTFKYCQLFNIPINIFPCLKLTAKLIVIKRILCFYIEKFSKVINFPHREVIKEKKMKVKREEYLFLKINN